MFRIVCDPSSGSIKLYLTEIRSGSLMFVVCLIGVWQLTHFSHHGRFITVRFTTYQMANLWFGNPRFKVLIINHFY